LNSRGYASNAKRSTHIAAQAIKKLEDADAEVLWN